MEIKKLNIVDFENLSKENCRILDMRNMHDFAEYHIPGSLNISLTPYFDKLTQLYLCSDQALILVLPEDKKKECLELLNDKKYNNIQGYLQGGINTWINNKKIDIIISLDAEAFHLDTKYGRMKIIDVRAKKEFNQLHQQEAMHMDIKTLISEQEELDRNNIYCMYCSDGIESMTLISWLKIHSWHNIYHTRGGFEEIKKHPDIPFLSSLKNQAKKSDGDAQ
jgi:hydroxyacylglutathione hydrolase